MFFKKKIPNAPSINDEDNYIAWFVRYSENLSDVREPFKDNLNNLIPIAVRSAKQELDKYKNKDALFERLSDIALSYEKNIKPLVEQYDGKLVSCPGDLMGAAVSMLVNISVITEYLEKKYKHDVIIRAKQEFDI